ncbi:MAG: tripartite tricarboxylate transporter substrate binding protein [Betaproteobacteria bacterium]|nr:tripartite tricarboxylate transporter substrate binding protein [Betaproteobacteria bacterium]
MCGLIRALGLAVLATLCAASSARAQDYPARPIRMILPANAGSLPDVLARTLSARLQERANWVTVINNRPGGNFIIGNAAAAQAAPDGYSILFAVSTMTQLPATQKSLPYDTMRDLAPVTRVGAAPTMIAVHPSVPARNLRDLIAWSKANPGKLNYGTGGAGSTTHLTGEFIRLESGLDWTNVPYRDSTRVMPDLLNGLILATITVPGNLLQQFNAGKLAPIAVIGSRRSLVIPDVPTTADAGFNIPIGDAWFGVMVPARVSNEIVATLHREVVAAVQSSELRQQY